MVQDQKCTQRGQTSAKANTHPAIICNATTSTTCVCMHLQKNFFPIDPIEKLDPAMREDGDT